jgi:hypothetical protein
VIKLYHAHTVTQELKHRGHIYEGVTIHWFVNHRDEPLIPYAEAFTDYESVNENDRLYAELSLNELLTEDEVKALERYLKAVHDESLVVTEVELPHAIKSVEDGQQVTVWGWGAIPAGGNTSHYVIDKPEMYELPEVWGYYDVREAEYRVDLTASTEYYKAFLQRLGMPIPSDEELHQAARSVTKDTGIYLQAHRVPEPVAVVANTSDDFGAGAQDTADDDFNPFAEE